MTTQLHQKITLSSLRTLFFLLACSTHLTGCFIALDDGYDDGYYYEDEYYEDVYYDDGYYEDHYDEDISVRENVEEHVEESVEESVMLRE